MVIFYSTDTYDNYINLHGDEHQHCTKVLRHQSGSKISVTDGKGVLYQCEIAKISKQETLCTIINKEVQASPDNLPTVAISLLKNPARLEWFVEKAVEIGIAEIILFQSVRTEKKAVNKDRTEKIMVAAMKQSLNLHLPKLTIFNNFDNVLVHSESFNGKYLAWCEDDTLPLQDVRNKKEKNILLIGPEGDFTKDEAGDAIKHGFTLVSLGNTRLRTETAGIVGLTMIRY
jgi:16S rRNA (uracil1498-N3)-methyltransferase